MPQYSLSVFVCYHSWGDDISKLSIVRNMSDVFVRTDKLRNQYFIGVISLDIF